MLFLRRVVGKSMLPALRPRQLVLAVRSRRAQLGDVIIVRYNKEEYIKRLTRADGSALYVLGDNAGVSTDSRDFGWLDRDTMRGCVVWPRHLRTDVGPGE